MFVDRSPVRVKKRHLRGGAGDAPERSGGLPSGLEVESEMTIEPATPMRPRLARSVAWIALVLLASPAWAAQVRDVRIGRHPDFTRVVFELDAPAGYKVERDESAPGSSELVISLDAKAAKRKVDAPRSLVTGVVIEPAGEGSIARIGLEGEGLLLKEMILAKPSRIVLDILRKEPRAPTRASAPKPVPKKTVAQSPEPSRSVPEPAPKPEREAAKAPSPEPVSEPEADAPAVSPPDSTGSRARIGTSGRIVRVEPPASLGPELAAKGRPSTGPAGSPVSPPSASDAPDPGTDLVPGTRSASPARSASPEGADDAAASGVGEPRQLAMAETPGTSPGGGAVSRPFAPAKPEPPRAARRDLAPKPAVAIPQEPASSFDPLMIGGIAAGGVALLAAGWAVARRRRAEVIPPEAFDDLPLDDDNPFAGVPSSEPRDSEFETSTESRSAEPSTVPFSVDDSSEKPDAELETELVDAPTPKGASMETGSEIPSTKVMDAIPADPDPVAGGTDVMRLVRELERRVANLETRLDEAVDARERLERQVAAQTEELRVQRAAIARTQRAVRNMSRPEEEAPTEPALRDPNRPGTRA